MVKGVRFCLITTLAFAALLTISECFGIGKNKFIYNNNGYGTYSFEYETPDGTYRREDGGIVSNSDGNSLVVRGEFGYIDSRGKQYVVRYVADANGYQPQTDDEETSEDVELRRIFPNEFPQDTIRKSGVINSEHLGRYKEIIHYFKFPKETYTSHFEELVCFDGNGKTLCKVNINRYSPAEDVYFMSPGVHSHLDKRRVFCLLLLCFTEDELDRVVTSF